MGSSLGGLVSFYIARRNPAVSGKAGCMSSSFWWKRDLDVVTAQGGSHNEASWARGSPSR